MCPMGISKGVADLEREGSKRVPCAQCINLKLINWDALAAAAAVVEAPVGLGASNLSNGKQRWGSASTHRKPN